MAFALPSRSIIHSRFSAFPTLLLATLVMHSCTGETGFRVSHRDGVTVAETVGGALYGDSIFTFEPILSLKQNPDDERSLLVVPLSFALGPDGRYYVPDRGDPRIAVYDGNGDYLRDLGRQGDGPGEFRSVWLQSIRGDTVSVFDYQLQRTSLLRTSGALLDVIRLPGGRMVIGLEMLADGRIVTEGVSSIERNNIGSIARRVTVLTPDGSDTLAVVATGYVATNMLQRIEMPDGSVSTLGTDIPYAPQAIVRYVPGRGIMATEGDRPEVRWYDLSGRLVRRWIADLESRPITRAIRSAFEERLRQRRAQQARERGTRPQPVRDLKYPNDVGFSGWGTADDAGYVWLQDVWSSYERTEGQGYGFHVFDPDGRYLGIAEAPAARFRIRAGRLMAIITDRETGEKVPTVFRITSAAEGLAYPD